jgi:hypothetical protein
MDYCGDSCMVMFTKGQVFNARKSIQEYRMDLVEKITPDPEPEIPYEEKHYKIYPTINNGRFTIEFNFTPESEYDLIVYDIGHKVVLRKNMLFEKTNYFDLSFLSVGTYIIVVKTVKMKLCTKRIVITNKSIHRIEKESDENYLELEDTY